MVLHAGSTTAGHYTAISRFGPDWALCNDDTVSNFYIDILNFFRAQPKYLLNLFALNTLSSTRSGSFITLARPSPFSLEISEHSFYHKAPFI